METRIISRRWAIVMMAVILATFIAPQLDAQDAKKPKKSRGDITAIDLEKKSITLENKKGEKTHSWDGDVKVKIDGEKGSLSEVKVGMFAICWLDDADKIVSMRATTPAKEEAAEKTPE